MLSNPKAQVISSLKYTTQLTPPSKPPLPSPNIRYPPLLPPSSPKTAVQNECLVQGDVVTGQLHLLLTAYSSPHHIHPSLQLLTHVSSSTTDDTSQSPWFLVYFSCCCRCYHGCRSHLRHCFLSLPLYLNFLHRPRKLQMVNCTVLLRCRTKLAEWAEIKYLDVESPAESEREQQSP